MARKLPRHVLCRCPAQTPHLPESTCQGKWGGVPPTLWCSVIRVCVYRCRQRTSKEHAGRSRDRERHDPFSPLPEVHCVVWDTMNHFTLLLDARLHKCAGSSHCGSEVKNPPSIHEDRGSIPGPTQWVKALALPQLRCRSQGSLDLVLPWLWRRPAAAVPIWPLAWELPYAAGAAATRRKKNV